VITIKSIGISINMAETFAVKAAGCSLTPFISSVTLSCDSSLLQFCDLQASGTPNLTLQTPHALACSPNTFLSLPTMQSCNGHENSSMIHLVEFRVLLKNIF